MFAPTQCDEYRGCLRRQVTQGIPWAPIPIRCRDHSSQATGGFRPRTEGGVTPNAPESLECSCLAQGQEKEGVHELSAADTVEVWLVGQLSLVTGTVGIEGKVPEMFAVVVGARHKRIEAPGEPVDGGVVGRVILVGEDDVEVSIELDGGQLPEVSRDKREADEIVLGAVAKDIVLDFSR